MTGQPYPCPGRTATIGPKTCTVLGCHWPAKAPWEGFAFSHAELRTGSIWGADDYHLGVPWAHELDIASGLPIADWGIYRLRLKKPWKSFVREHGEWIVSMDPPA